MKNKLTKVFAVLVVAAMVLALTGCPDGIKDKAGTYTTQSSLEQILADGELKGIDLAKLTWKPLTEEVYSGFTKILELNNDLICSGEIESKPEGLLDNDELSTYRYCVISSKGIVLAEEYVKADGRRNYALFQ